MQIFLELTTIVLIATVVSFLMRLLKQPLIVGYILSGIIAGPYFLNALHSTEFIDILSKMGIAILLFVVGLTLSPKVIKEVGKVSLLTGIGQVVFTALIGFGISISLGIDRIAALYIAVALTFSSTIIVLKLLSDKGDLNKLYGKIAIGFLLVQDILASIFLIVVSSIGASAGGDVSLMVLLVILKGTSVAIALYLISQFVLPHLVRFAASSQELLFLFSIGWGLALASLFYFIGFSAEIGALIAGVMLSVTPFAHEIGSRLKPLRDFFIVLFFILVGSQMQLDALPRIIGPALILSVFVLVGNPLIMIVIMHVLGYKRKTAYMTGLITAQISEFSLILAGVGFSLGQLSRDGLSLIALVGLITIAGSTYLILYADALYPYVEKFLKLLEFRAKKSDIPAKQSEYDVLVFGFDRVGHDFMHLFEKMKKKYLVVDFNPYLITKMENHGIPCLYGDAEDVEFLAELNLHQVKLCVSTIPDHKTSLLLLKHLRKANPKVIIVMLSHDIHTARELYDLGANYVILPHYLSAKHTAHMIEKLGFDVHEFDVERQRHLNYMAERDL